MSGATYGKKITKDEANRHFDLVMQIKRKSHGRLKDALKNGDKDAVRFYCGKEGEYNTDLCFLFSKNIIAALIEAMNNGDVDGIAIFNGVRSKEDSRNESTGAYSDVDGRPTVMIFPYKDTGNKNAEGEEEIVIMGDDGYEHPGTGGKPGGGLLEPNAEGKYELPTSFNRSEVWKFNQL